MDIGAYELGSPMAFMVNSFTNAGMGSGNVGDLVYCIGQANANPDPAGSVIEFDPTAFATARRSACPARSSFPKPMGLRRSMAPAQAS